MIFDQHNTSCQIISNIKLLCYSNTYYLFSRGTKIYYKKVGDKKYQLIGVLSSDYKLSCFSSLRLLNRVFRLEPRCGVFIDENIALISYHGGVYRIDCINRTIYQEHIYRPGMNNPLCFSNLRDIDGIEDGIYYGEYFGNASGGPVKIMKRTSDGQWSCAYEFAAGTINHIHNIIPHQSEEAVFILTGDMDSQSAIWKCKDNFNDVQPILIGKQMYRAAIAFPVEHGLIYATDTPLADNFIYWLDLRSETLKKIMPIKGPAIYGKMISCNEFIFSTSVEPDSRLKGLRYKLSFRLGEGVKDRKSHIYQVKLSANGEIDCKEILCAEKDFFPMLLFQFGTFMFPLGNTDGKVFATGQSLKRLDKKTLLIDLNHF